MMDPNLILTALNEAGKLAEVIAKKVEAANAINVFTDRAQTFADLFDPVKHDDAYRTIYADIQIVLAKKQISPSQYWYDTEKKTGAPCISIPLATLKELIDAATR